MAVERDAAGGPSGTAGAAEPTRPAEAALVAEGPDTPVVRAAGGIVWRTGGDGGPELLLVHRPRYDDWTFPKGKLDRGETHEAGARREVEEETGLRCTLGAELTSTSYIDRKGRPKVVRYWTMTVEGGTFVPTDEVDEIRWVTAEQARWLLSYDRDREVLDTFLEGV